jgi:hypothetical protein
MDPQKMVALPLICADRAKPSGWSSIWIKRERGDSTYFTAQPDDRLVMHTGERFTVHCAHRGATVMLHTATTAFVLGDDDGIQFTNGMAVLNCPAQRAGERVPVRLGVTIPQAGGAAAMFVTPVFDIMATGGAGAADDKQVLGVMFTYCPVADQPFGGVLTDSE